MGAFLGKLTGRDPGPSFLDEYPAATKADASLRDAIPLTVWVLEFAL